MRKLGAALLAVPVLASLYLEQLTRQHAPARLIGGIAASAVIAVVLVASLPPSPGAAVRASQPRAVTAQLLGPVRTGHSVVDPFRVRFDTPMDAPSVAGAVRLVPDAAVTLSWDAAGTELTIAPAAHWQPDTLYTVTVDTSARSEGGGRLSIPVRAVVLTAPAGVARIEPTRTTGGSVRVDTAFRIRLDRPLDPAAVKAALRSEPAVHGDLARGATPGEYLFTPWSRLAPGTAYRVWLDGLTDADGIPFETAGALAVRTAGAPGVVRFRPRSGTDAVDRTALLSVRFTQPMNRAATAAAFHVTAAGHPVAGATSWAEGGEVLVFRPAAALAYGADVVMTVDGGARSRTGASVAAPAEATFTVASRPKPKTGSSHHAAAHRSSPGSRPIHHSGGGGAVSGSWHSVEAYYLRLMNCTRTGGWVTSKGNCSSPGGRSVAPLSLSSGISTRVSRPYAKLLASHGWCDHFIGGSPGDRLRHAGYRSYRWAENLGCRSGNPYSAVLGSHLYFQSERPYNGGHYRNLMNAAYDRVGIGVWVAHRNVRLVVDFYHP